VIGGWAFKACYERRIQRYTVNAIRWAQEHLGSTEYAARCLAFVEDAYEESNHVEIFGGDGAQASADEYGAAQNRGEPADRDIRVYACAGPGR
jgi:hypothetical protein